MRSQIMRDVRTPEHMMDQVNAARPHILATVYLSTSVKPQALIDSMEALGFATPDIKYAINTLFDDGLLFFQPEDSLFLTTDKTVGVTLEALKAMLADN